MLEHQNRNPNLTGEHPSLPETSRREFMGVLGSLAASLALPGRNLHLGEAGVSIEVVQKLVQGIEGYVSSQKALAALSSGFEFFHQARDAIASTISVTEQEVSFDPVGSKRIVNRLVSERGALLREALTKREEAVLQLAETRSVLVQILDGTFNNAEGGEQIDVDRKLGALSQALAAEHSGAEHSTLRALLAQESNELRAFTLDTLRNAGEGAISKTGAYQLADGTKVYRQADGSLGLDDSFVSSWSRASSSERYNLDDKEITLSPMIYLYSQMPESKYSLEVEHRQLANELQKYLVDRIEGWLRNSAGMSSQVRESLEDIAFQSPFKSIESKAVAYLQKLQEIADTTPLEEVPAEIQGLVQDPRREVASTLLGRVVESYRFEELPQATGSIGFRLWSRNRLSNWSDSPFQRQKVQSALHGVMAECVQELIDEGRCFFYKVPVSSLDEFVSYARIYRYSDELAAACLPVFGRMLTKGYNPTANLRALF